MHRATPRACPSVVCVGAAAAALALAGCAAAPAAWKVQPQYRVDHAAPAAPGQGYAALARRYSGERRWADALDAWRKAAMEAPDDVDILNALAMAEAGQGHNARAIAALRRAVALAPQRAHLLNNLGYALMLDGQADAARALLREAIALDPRHALARANLERADQAAALALPVPPVAAAATPPAAVTTVEAAAPALRVLTAPDVPALVVVAAPPERSERSTLPAVAAPLVPLTNGHATLALLPAAQPALVEQGPAVAAAQPPARPPAPTAPEAPAALPAAPHPADAPAGPPARVEIANGNGVAGLAAWTGRWLRRQGQPGSARLVNLPPYRSELTAVHYGPGWQAQARALAHRLPGSVALVADTASPSPRADLRVVLGHDWRGIARCTACAPMEPATAVAQVGAAR